MGTIPDPTKTSSDEEDCLFAMQLVSSVVMPMVMQTVLELQVFEIIAKAGEGAQLSPAEIVSHLPTQNPNAADMLDRLLRLLANYSILTSSTAVHHSGTVERQYGLAPVCKYFIPNEDGVSFSPWKYINHDDAYIRAWSGLKDAILGGGNAFTKVHGMPLFEYAGEHPHINQSFNIAMVSHTNIIMKKTLEVYKGFENLTELIDVGGGIGTASQVIISKYPTIKCITMDLPHVIRSAPYRSGIQYVEGDMFLRVPKGDAIFLKSVLHDWDDEHCIKLLQNCYEALPDNGTVTVMDMVVSHSVEDSVSAKVASQMDVIMCANLEGAKERTKKEFERLAKGAGFHSIKFVCCVCNNWIMEFYKMSL